MQGNYEDTVREQLRHYADVADNAARKMKRHLSALATEIEVIGRTPLDVPSTADMDDMYQSRTDGIGNVLYIRAENSCPGEMIWLAMGVPRTPFTEATRRKLRSYERATSSMLRIYGELDYVDELWFFDRESNIALGRIDYRWSNLLVPGLDLNALHDMGMSFYDWFRAADLPNNPHRQVVCSASPFIEIMNQWILHLKAPVFRNRYGPGETFVGITTVHIKLPWLMRDTIDTSSLPMLIAKDDSTLVALNEAARERLEMETYDPGKFRMESVFDPAVWAQKRKLVAQNFNLEHDKPEDVTSFARKVKSEYAFTHSLQGKKFRVVREEAKELGLNYVALLAQR
jgi:hypothetical protein